MNWIQFCIIMFYLSFALSCLHGWANWFESLFLIVGIGWLIAAVIIALGG